MVSLVPIEVCQPYQSIYKLGLKLQNMIVVSYFSSGIIHTEIVFLDCIFTLNFNLFMPEAAKITVWVISLFSYESNFWKISERERERERERDVLQSSIYNSISNILKIYV